MRLAGEHVARSLLGVLLLLSPAVAWAQHPPLERGRTVSGTLAATDTARYALSVPDSTFVLGELNQISVDVLVRVLDGDGEQISRFDGLGRGLERFAGRIAEGGTYTVEVVPVDEESGAYELTLQRVERIASDPKKRTDQIMARFDADHSPGAAVQVWRDGRTLYSKAYGMANLAYDLPFATDTRTNIGSTSKQFTAFAVLLQASRGLLSLDDDIRDHVPELPAFDHTIRVRHLITHTSGLREFLNLLIMTGRRLDHGDWIDREELIDIVQRQPALQNEPGAEFNYNNTAFGLAAIIVERTSGKPFHEFMQESVFGPLGMSRTMVRPTPEHIVEGASEGYTPGHDGYRMIGDLGGAVGAGGIYSTVEDLQTWAWNYLDPRVGTPDLVEQMTTSFVLNDGEETGYGYGLFVDEQNGVRRVHHGGADVAHRSMLAMYPDLRAGVTVQSNHAAFNSSVAFEIAAAFFADALGARDAVTEDAFDPDSYDPEDFDAYVGRYALDAAPNFILTFTREGSTLYTQATGQPRIEIVPTSDSTFALTRVEASLVFHRDEEGEVEGLTLNQNGQQHATRLADDEGEQEAWEPDADALGDFIGRYFSPELETFYTIVLDEDALVVQHRRLDDVRLRPRDPDAFSGGNLQFAFERDRNHQVIGFYVANGRTRDVRFERVR